MTVVASLWRLEDLAHIPVFAGLAALLLILTSGRSTLWHRSALVAAVCVTVGVAIEALQWASGTRAAELSDVFYNVVGTALGIGVAAIGLRITSRPVLAILVGAGVVVALIALPEPDRGFQYRSAEVERRCMESSASPPSDDLNPTDAIAAEPLVQYQFSEGDGAIVHDVVGDLHLEIGDTGTVSWEPDGGLTFDGGPHRTRSKVPATELSAAVTASDEVSIEAWFEAASLPQGGPARLATVSEGPNAGEANVHLAIDGNSLSFRVLTDCDYYNQTTSSEELIAGQLHHVVATYRPGVVEIFVDGKRVLTREVQYGSLETWDPARHFFLADEATADLQQQSGRRFSGTLYGVAAYDQALSSSAVEKLYTSGPGS